MALQRETITLSGAAPDPFPQDAPAAAWNSVENVFFRNGESIRAGGDLAVFPAEAAPPLTLQYTELFGTPYWIYATAAGVFVTDGVTRSDITPSGWSAPVADEVFTSCVIGGLVVVNGSARDPVWWPGLASTPCEPLPGWPSGGRCLAMRTHKSFLFAVGRLDFSPNFIAWSSAADPGAVPDEWTPSASNLAGFLTLSPGVDPCLEARTLRDSLLVYKGESVWSLDFVADTSVVFQARKLFSHTGIAGTKAIAGDHQRHVYIDRMGDIFATDGTMAQSILDGLAQRFFYAELAERPQGRLIGATLADRKSVV